MNVLFLAPLKPPDHPEPSGDREMARLLIRALEGAGCAVRLGSRLRMLDRRGDTAVMQDLAAQARREADRILAEIEAGPAQARPDLVFTYHVHYKAPDVIGPLVARALAIPLVVAEGSRAPKRARGPWAEGHRLAETALDAADLVLVMNERDRPMLEAARAPGQAIATLLPFADAAAWPDARVRRRAPSRPLRLLAVAMMRPGDKLASYALLADALARLDPGGWTLDVAGDGPAQDEVRRRFAAFGDAVRWCGRVADRAVLARLYAGADLLAWPAVNEAYGMVFLEAGLQGCPALAGRFGGVPGVVIDGDTGRLVPGGDAVAFADALAAFIADPAALDPLSRGAARLSREERTLAQASASLAALLDPLVRDAPRRGHGAAA
ncbi:MAG: glycosyltransferase family 4 protein [Alsobacter sp.]